MRRKKNIRKYSNWFEDLLRGTSSWIVAGLVIFPLSAASILYDVEIRRDRPIRLMLMESLDAVVDRAESIAILLAAAIYIKEIPERRDRKHYEAWQVIDAASSNTSRVSYARLKALQDLNRDSVPFQYLDVSRANLSRIDLRYAFLKNSNLSGTVLSYASLSDSELIDSNLSEANFSHARLIKCDFNDSKLCMAKFSFAYIENVDFTNADLRNADFSGATLISTNLMGARFLKREQLEGENPPLIYNVKLPAHMANIIDQDRDREGISREIRDRENISLDEAYEKISEYKNQVVGDINMLT